MVSKAALAIANEPISVSPSAALILRKRAEGLAATRRNVRHVRRYQLHLASSGAGMPTRCWRQDGRMLNADLKQRHASPRRQIPHGGVMSAVLDVATGFAVHLQVSKKMP